MYVHSASKGELRAAYLRGHLPPLSPFSGMHSGSAVSQSPRDALDLNQARRSQPPLVCPCWTVSYQGEVEGTGQDERLDPLGMAGVNLPHTMLV